MCSQNLISSLKLIMYTNMTVISLMKDLFHLFRVSTTARRMAKSQMKKITQWMRIVVVSKAIIAEKVVCEKKRREGDNPCSPLLFCCLKESLICMRERDGVFGHEWVGE